MTQRNFEIFIFVTIIVSLIAWNALLVYIVWEMFELPLTTYFYMLLLK